MDNAGINAGMNEAGSRSQLDWVLPEGKKLGVPHRHDRENGLEE
jgi:hypothetical protein